MTEETTDATPATSGDAPANDDATFEPQAREMGWVPESEFKGEKRPAKFLSAKEFVQRGEEFLPIVRAQNRELKGKVSQLEGQLLQVNQTLRSAQESIEALKEFNSAEKTVRLACWLAPTVVLPVRS